jgi:hypothetical protein
MYKLFIYIKHSLDVVKHLSITFNVLHIHILVIMWNYILKGKAFGYTSRNGPLKLLTMGSI